MAVPSDPPAHPAGNPQGSTPGSQDDAPLPIPNLKLPQLVFTLTDDKTKNFREGAQDKLVKAIEDDEMTPYLSHLISASVLPASSHSDLLSSLQQKNTDALSALASKLDDARANLGESEVAEALRERASYLAKIGEKGEAVKAYEEAFEASAGKGTKIDLVLSIVRVGFFHQDFEIVTTGIERAQ
ncbi:hypothetical protein JCM8097_002078, partial [Rhodosporidiobolus ruineniae]